MRILVANPALIRLNALGACEQDRLTNVHDLKRLGHTVRVITRANPTNSPAEMQDYYATHQIEARVVPAPMARMALRRLSDPALLDGAAWEYGDAAFLDALRAEVSAFKPELVWSHTTYLWPVANAVRALPTVVRSVNYEPLQVIHEQKATVRNRMRQLFKEFGERHAAHATVLAAITPTEQAIYHGIVPNATVELLPLRTLPDLLRQTAWHAEKAVLHVFSMGASYNVPHNREALAFVVEQVLPRLRQQAPNQFVLHVLGSKVPKDFQALAAPDLRFDGYVPDLDTHLAQMDIALSPRLSGVGMQQKIFEPLCRGFPSITHPGGLAGYDFRDEEHLLLANDADGYVRHLLALRDLHLRRRIGQAAFAQASVLFSRSAMDERVKTILDLAVHRNSV